jgi:hypothetical protein
MASSNLIALAILKVNWEAEGNDYLDNFVPMVVACLADANDDVVSLPDVQSRFSERFGIDIPLNPLNALLRRAARGGFLRRDQGVYYREPAALTSSFDDAEQEIGAALDAIISGLQGHAQSHFELDLAAEDAENALLAFLSAQDATLLFASYEGTPLARPKEDESHSYIVASFIYDAWEQDSAVFGQVESLAKGHILATALFLQDPGQVLRRFKGTKVFFDTSFLIFAAGYAGETREAPRKELLELLRNAGAELRYFPETINELRGVLDACAAMVRRGDLRYAYGPSMEYFIQRGASSSDIDLLAARSTERLRFLGLEQEDRPSYKEHDHVIDEEAFEKHLDVEIGYRKAAARRHDLDCVSAVVRLRRGREVFVVEECVALFLTTNVALAKATRGFFQADASPGSVPLCLTDFALGNLLWLKNPAIAPELPKRRLIADAYATLQPSDNLWKKYLVEIARLEERKEISNDDYYLLRYSASAKRAFMDLTQGAEETFTEGTVAEVLQLAIENARADLAVSLEGEKEKREAAERVASERGTELKVARKETSARADLQTFRRRTVALRIAKGISWVPRGAAYALMVVGAVYAFPWNFPSPKAAWFQYLVTGAFLVLFVLTLAGVGWGHTIQSLMVRFEALVADWVAGRLEWLQGEDQPPEV